MRRVLFVYGDSYDFKRAPFPNRLRIAGGSQVRKTRPRIAAARNAGRRGAPIDDDAISAASLATTLAGSHRTPHQRQEIYVDVTTIPPCARGNRVFWEHFLGRTEYLSDSREPCAIKAVRPRNCRLSFPRFPPWFSRLARAASRHLRPLGEERQPHARARAERSRA